MSMQELVLVRGCAGTGKSTICQNNFLDHVFFEADHMMCDCRGKYRYDSRLFPEAIKWVHKMADTVLSDGLSVIVSEVFLRIEDIEPYLELTKHHGCELKIIECTKYHGSTHGVPLWQIERMRAAWQPITSKSGLYQFLMNAPK